MSDIKFIPGTKVYKRYGHYGRGNHWQEDYVEKVYKNGNFTLRSASKQQWRPWADGSACMAGDRDRFSRWTLRIADAEMESTVARLRAEKSLKDRCHRISATLDKASAEHLTDEILTEIETAIKKLFPAVEPVTEKVDD